MERLTFIPNDGGNIGLRGFCTEQDAIDRLAAYEDTGLTPEEVESMMSMREIPPEIEYAIDKHASSVIEKLDSLLSREDNSDHVKDLLNAESEGRLLVLPCKIGAPVWFVVRDVDDPGRWEICEPQKVTEVGPRGFWIGGLLDEPDGMHMFTPWSALGSEAFLSREAAEAKLKTLQNT